MRASISVQWHGATVEDRDVVLRPGQSLADLVPSLPLGHDAPIHRCGPAWFIDGDRILPGVPWRSAEGDVQVAVWIEAAEPAPGWRWSARLVPGMIMAALVVWMLARDTFANVHASDPALVHDAVMAVWPGASPATVPAPGPHDPWSGPSVQVRVDGATR